MSSYSFKNKVAVITGAGSGIGRALAQQLAAEGAKLALSDIDESGLAATLALLPAGTKAKGYRLDVASRQAFFEHAEDVKRDFGTAHLLFNNAGATVVGTVENMDLDEYEWQIGINLWGVLYGTKAFLPMMLAQREGWIVNLSSIFGLIGYPAQSAYNITKFAVRGLTEALWAELEGTGVNALCVHPGGIKTSIERAARRCRNAGEVEAGFAGKAANLLRTPPEVCATDILNGVRRGKRRVLTGHKSGAVWWLSRLLPNHYPALVKLMG